MITRTTSRNWVTTRRLLSNREGDGARRRLEALSLLKSQSSLIKTIINHFSSQKTKVYLKLTNNDLNYKNIYKKMTKFSIVNRRYGYLHECKWALEAIDMHHVVVRKSNAKGFFVCLSALIVVANAASYLFLVKDKSITILLWSFLLSVLLVKVMFWNRVMKESVVVMPTFGVQLETHYVSGRIVHRFVPIDKILKPLLLECVSPVTCYWSLSLLLRGEAELMLVFKELRPPVKMLIPIWKALCDAFGIKEGSDTWKDVN